jgi:predicted nucleic acid-binding protein
MLVARRETVSAESRELGRLISGGHVRMPGPIRQELLSGIRDRRQFERLETSLKAFPDAILEKVDYVLAASFYNLCRGNGIQGSNTDFLICTAAVRLTDTIFTTDADFTLFARHLPISLQVPLPSV